MIKELTDILAQIPEEQKHKLEASLQQLAFTPDSVIEAKLGGGAFPDDGVFSIGVGILIKAAAKTQNSGLSLQQVVDGISKDVHQSADWLFAQFREKATLPYRLEATSLTFIDHDRAVLHFSIDTPLKDFSPSIQD